VLSKIKVDVYGIHSDFQQIKREWSWLCDSAKPSLFLSWEWIENWIKTLPEKVSVFLIVLTGNNIPKTGFFVGAPSPKMAGFFIRSLYLNTTGDQFFDKIYIEYNSILVENNSPVPLDEIIPVLPLEWDEFVMPGLDPQFFLKNNFEGVTDLYNLIIHKVLSPYVDLAKVRENGLNFLGLLSKNTRSQIHRSYRLYQKEGDIILKEASTISQAMDILIELIKLHQKSWQRRGKVGCFSNDYLLKFHMRFLERYFETGGIQLARLCCGNNTIGCIYNLVGNDKVYFYQSGLAKVENYKYKPGLMLHSEAIQFNSRIGNSIYDFLAGPSQYKKSLSTDENELIWARLQKKKIKISVYNLSKKIYLKLRDKIVL